MQKIVLYYLFVPIPDPEAVRLWQRNLCEKLNLKGRILIAEHGINGTVGGDLADLKSYVKATKQYSNFKSIVFKWSDGSREDFPKLLVKVRSEIVTFGVPEKIQVDEDGIKGGGIRLKPEQVNQMVQKHGDKVVFFDGRNAYEAAIGKFKNAVVTEAEHSRDFVHELQKPKYEPLKDKMVITYCTGGIRCEVLTVLMREQGFKDVYQIDGGIVKYGETYGDTGLWEGSLYVFDDRMGIQFSDQAKDIGTCVFCGTKTSHYVDCAITDCNKLFVACSGCAKQSLCPECETTSVGLS
jgi:UPF0176 protein